MSNYDILSGIGVDTPAAQEKDRWKDTEFSEKEGTIGQILNKVLVRAISYPPVPTPAPQAADPYAQAAMQAAQSIKGGLAAGNALGAAIGRPPISRLELQKANDGGWAIFEYGELRAVVGSVDDLCAWIYQNGRP